MSMSFGCRFRGGGVVGIGELLLKTKLQGSAYQKRGARSLNRLKIKTKGVPGELRSSRRQSLSIFICSWERQEEI